MEKILIDYLQENCKGYENRVKANVLMEVVGLKDHKTFRSLIEEIRQSSRKVFICSEAGHKGGYWLPTTKEEIEQTIEHLEKRAYEMFKTAKILRKKVGM
jgi:hypothetical protein